MHAARPEAGSALLASPSRRQSECHGSGRHDRPDLAIINAHYDAAALLLDCGADPNIGDVAGMTPLYAAVDMNTFAGHPGRPTPKPSGNSTHQSTSSRLLLEGANPNARQGPISSGCTIAVTGHSEPARHPSCVRPRRATSR